MNNNYYNSNSNINTLSINSHHNINNTNLKKKMKTEKNDPHSNVSLTQKNSPQLPFSSRFFLTVVTFMIFNVEIALLLPMPIITMTSNTKSWMTISLVFLLILIIGLYHEWNQGSPKWRN